MQAEVARVAFGLFEHTWNVGGLTLGLDNSYKRASVEKRVVNGTRSGRPLGDGTIAALLGACAETVAKGSRIGLPAGGAKLGVDEQASLALVEFIRECAGGVLRLLHCDVDCGRRR